jgi:hypothetical protein
MQGARCGKKTVNSSLINTRLIVVINKAATGQNTQTVT